MKGQITRHEWAERMRWIDTCPHCETIKITPNVGSVSYIPKGHKGPAIPVEPPCITRKIQADGTANN